jgi:hypothetical protein
MDFEHGFTLWRELGKTAAGHYLPFPALTAIHWVHRNFAAVVVLVLGLHGLARLATMPGLHQTVRNMALVLAAQALTGIATVYLNFPLAIAVLHNAGAAGLVLLVTMLNYKVQYQLDPARTSPRARAVRPPCPRAIHDYPDRHPQTVASRIAQYWALTKPRVTQLAVFCAVIGMFLATDGFPGWHVLIWGTIGIWLLAGAAFAVNCLIEAEVDARMARTARRATAMGELSTTQTLIFSAIIGGAGMGVLYTWSTR